MVRRVEKCPRRLILTLGEPTYEPRHEKTCLCHMRKQQRCRSACEFVQSDQHLCCSLSGSIIPLLAIAEISISHQLSVADRFESYRAANPEDRFSCDRAHTQHVHKWDRAQQNDLCPQRGLRSVCTSSQSDQSLLSTWRRFG